MSKQTKTAHSAPSEVSRLTPQTTGWPSEYRTKYEYDSLGQVKSGKRYWSDGTPVAGQQFEYGFDDIGNRTQTKAGGDQSGAGLRPASYTANNLNQYTQRTVPGTNDVIGAALATNGVTVNTVTAYRKGEYFRGIAGTDNSSSPAWLGVTVSSGGTNLTGNVFIAKTPELFSHDADGNLTQDGRWSYEWDAENRLKVMRSLSGSPVPERRLEFEYDAQGRRIRQTVWNDRDSGQGSELSDLAYVYDGWNLLAELDANASNAKVRTYVWGLDLSGSEQGAGGVGGLLAMAYYGAQTTNCFVAYDGNGNVMALVNGVDGNAVAQYEYGPFGEVIRATGPMAGVNPFRFSTKYQDGESDLLYYGYRFYMQSMGRWLSRDPVGEDGGVNLNGFVGNKPVLRIDALGLWYETSVAEYERRLARNKVFLFAKLASLCPCDSATFTAMGKEQRCTRLGCLIQAAFLATEMARKAEVVWRTQFKRYGNVAVGWPLENWRADRAPGHGKTWTDYDQGHGLTCEGWTELMGTRVFYDVEEPWLRAQKLCFRGATVGTKDTPWPWTSLHNWVAIYGPGRGSTEDLMRTWTFVDVTIDGWETAGAEIMPLDPRTPERLSGRILW